MMQGPIKKIFRRLMVMAAFFATQGIAFASEADLKIPDLHEGRFEMFGGLSGFQILFYGAFVIVGTVGLSHRQRDDAKEHRAGDGLLLYRASA